MKFPDACTFTEPGAVFLGEEGSDFTLVGKAAEALIQDAAVFIALKPASSAKFAVAQN